MVYLLIGGPRAGQLVDGLPHGYRFAPKLEDRHFVEVVLEGVAADAAVWTDGEVTTVTTEPEAETTPSGNGRRSP